MMRLRDAAILAGTKLRTRKTRTIVTAVLASLLFAALVFACTVVKGSIDSYARYSKNGLSQRYITNVFYFSGMGLDYSSPTLIAAAKEQNKVVIAEKKADAKRLGIEYDAATEPSVTLTDGQGSTGEYLNTQNYAVQQVIGAELAKEATPAARTNAISAAYHPTQIYETKLFGDTTNLKIMESGKESFTTNTKNQVVYGNDPLTTLSYVSRDLVGSFLLDNADLTPAKTTTDAVPVIVTFSNAEKALGLKALPNTATNAERLARIQEVKRRAANATVTACYRNSSSAQAIETAKQQIAEREKRKNDRTYQQPSQLYALPDASSCGAVVVTKDTRSAEEKRLAAKQHEFNVKYNIEIEPVQKKLTFRIVGLSADTPDYANMSTFDNLAMLLGGSSLMGQWVIPSEFVDESIRGEFIPQGSPGDVSTWYSTGVLGTLVEFGSPADAKRFLTEQNCNMECSSKPVITFFGSNSVLIEDLMNNAAFVLRIAGGVVATIAAFLMMGMVGRVITDSRRETAVFRAIGAKRNDIRLIYTLYVLAFSLIIVCVAMVIGFAAASLYSASVTELLTTSARLMFIETKEPGAFILIGMWPEALALTAGIIMLAGLISTALPLGRSLVRSPLKDMRDE